MYAKSLRVFSGDVYGYVDYLSVITIDGLDNIKFVPIEYEYDALTNTTNLKLKQILNDEIPSNDLEISLYYEDDNVVEPTIRG